MKIIDANGKPLSTELARQAIFLLRDVVDRETLSVRMSTEQVIMLEELDICMSEVITVVADIEKTFAPPTMGGIRLTVDNGMDRDKIRFEHGRHHLVGIVNLARPEGYEKTA